MDVQQMDDDQISDFENEGNHFFYHKYICNICNYIYDEEDHGPLWADVPEDWRCPECSASKKNFKYMG